LEFLEQGTGPVRQLLERLGKIAPGYRAVGCTPIEYLDRLGLLGPRTLLIHAQHLRGDDEARIARALVPVVVCPGTIEWFGRPSPPVPELLANGATVALGTDSLLSNRELSMPGEMARLRGRFPTLAAAKVLAMATSAGRKALGIPPGRADVVLVPALGSADATLEALTRNELPVLATIAGGNLLHCDPSLEWRPA
jgi:cytosine/adenosine deaminase-related metal-dependent hydrolase